MSVRSSQSITTQFTTRVFSTGVLTDADSTPTGTLYVNGTANGATVTVTKISTGLYKAAFTLPTLAVGDLCCLIIAATVSSVSDAAKVWEDTKDLVIDSAGLTDANVVKLGPSGSGTAQTARDIGASVLLSSGTGTGQLDFTSGVVKANTTQIAGSAVSTTTAQIGVNVVNVGGTVQTARDLGSSVLLSVGTGTGQVNLSSGKVPATIAAGDLATDSITSAAIATSAVTEIQSGLMTAAGYTAPDNTTIAAIASTLGTAGAGLTAIGDTRLANLDATVSSRLAASSYTAPTTPPTVIQIRTEMDTNSTKLANLDATVSSRSTLTQTQVTGGAYSIQSASCVLGDARVSNLDAAVSSRLATSGYSAPPSAASIRTEIDTNSTKLDATVSSRLAASSYTAPDNAGITTVGTQTTAASIRSALGMAAADLDDQLALIPTTIRIKKNTAFTGFSFAMFDSSGSPATGVTVTSQVAIDGAAFVSTTNSASEIGSGAYKLNLAAADTNGNDLMFLFTATGCKSLFLKVVTQP